MTPDPIPQAAREIAERHCGRHIDREWELCEWYTYDDNDERKACTCGLFTRVESLAREIAEYGRTVAQMPLIDHFKTPPAERIENARKLNAQTAKWIGRVRPEPPTPDTRGPDWDLSRGDDE